MRETTAPLTETWHHDTRATEAVSCGNHLSCQYFREAERLSGQFSAIIPSYFSFAWEGHLITAWIHIVGGALYQPEAAPEGSEQLSLFLKFLGPYTVG